MCRACTAQQVDLLASSRAQDAHDAEVQGRAARPSSSDYTVRAGTGLVAALEARGERAVEECGQLIDAIVHAGHGEGRATGVVYVSGRELSCMPVPLSANARAVSGCAERGGVGAGVLKGWLKGAGDKGKAREDEDGDSAPTEESWQITQVGCGGVMAEKREWHCDAASVLLLRKSTHAHTHVHARHACVHLTHTHGWRRDFACVCVCVCVCVFIYVCGMHWQERIDALKGFPSGLLVVQRDRAGDQGRSVLLQVILCVCLCTSTRTRARSNRSIFHSVHYSGPVCVCACVNVYMRACVCVCVYVYASVFVS
jgi:hypothetical protein